MQLVSVDTIGYTFVVDFLLRRKHRRQCFAKSVSVLKKCVICYGKKICFRMVEIKEN